LTLVDAALWASAAVLLAAALIVQARQERPWDPAVYFAASLAAARRAAGLAPVPLTGGPIPAEGWDGDVDALDDDVSPDVRLAPGLDWGGVSGTEALAAIARRASGVHVVWFEEPTVVIEGVAAAIFADVDEEGASQVLSPLLERPEARLVIAAATRADFALRLLAASPGLRDRLRAVLLVGARPDAAWLAASFTHPGFDVEVQREVPYLVLRVGGSPMLPDPPDPPTARRSIAAVDLGEIDAAALAEPSTARALGALVAAVG
jgi:hypothetical protein